MAHYIHHRNKQANESSKHIPLAGIAIGDGWTDPVNQIPVYPDLMYNFGLISLKQKAVVKVRSASLVFLPEPCAVSPTCASNI
jgi:hypothetical protein